MTAPGDATPKLAVRNLYKVFGPEPDRSLEMARQGLGKDEILRETGGILGIQDASLDVFAGEIFVIMGLSGSGKSPLIRCFNRLIDPSSGSLTIDGEDILQADAEAVRRLRLERISMVFQHFALLPHRTVGENVEYGLKVRGLPRSERRERALKSLSAVGLEEWADVPPSSLSGGMRQRVGLARALAVDPDILLMDEPFSALDPLIRREMQGELVQLQRKYRKTIIFVTHDLTEALTLGDRIAIMKSGRIVQLGTPTEILLNPADDYVAAFTADIDRSRVLPLRTVAEDGPKPKGAIETLPADRPLAEAYGPLSQGQPVALVDDDGKFAGMVQPEALFAALAGREGPEAEPRQES